MSRKPNLEWNLYCGIEKYIYISINSNFSPLIIITEGEFALSRREQWTEFVGATGSRRHCYIKTRLLFIIEHSLNTCADTLVAITKGQRETGVHLFLDNRERGGSDYSPLPVSYVPLCFCIFVELSCGEEKNRRDFSFVFSFSSNTVRCISRYCTTWHVKSTKYVNPLISIDPNAPHNSLFP